MRFAHLRRPSAQPFCLLTASVPLAGLQHAEQRPVQAQHQLSFFNARERHSGRSKRDKQMSQEGLISHLVQSGYLKTQACIDAMRSVDRQLFVDPQQMHGSVVYQDHPLPNGPTETVSAPHMHAIALELLADRLAPGNRVLDVGSGSGYLTACFAHAVMPDGFVLGIEKHTDLVQRSLKSLHRCIPTWMGDGSVQVRAGNILGELKTDGTKFDAIHVGAAAAEMPGKLRELLAPGGKMLIPIGEAGSRGQALTLVKRAEDTTAEQQFEAETLMGVAFVPLTAP